MININLNPIDEEPEDTYWYVPDLLLLLVLSIGSYFAVNIYLTQIKREIVRISEDKKYIEKNYDRLKPDLDRYVNFKLKVENLRKKIISLSEISISKTNRYKPAIILEHLQRLKPKGLWFTYLKDESKNNIIRLTGRSYDNIIVSDFISALQSTSLQTLDLSDARTMIYFSRTYLGRVSVSSAQQSSQIVRSDPEYKAFIDSQSDNILGQQIGGAIGSSSTLFPEMSHYPAFELSIEYKERTDEVFKNFNE